MSNDNGFRRACPTGNHMTEEEIWREGEKRKEEREENDDADNNV